MGNIRKSPGSKLNQLPADQQETVFAHCEKTTIPDGIRWLAAEHHIVIGRDALSRWMKERRVERQLPEKLRKTRPDSILGMLNPEQKDEVETYCEEVSLEKGVQWLAEHMNLSVSTNGLSAWLQRRRTERTYAANLEKIRENSNHATLVGNVFGAAAALTEANIVMLAQAVFEELNKEPEERDEKRLLLYMKLALQGRNMALAYERFHFDAAKKATECAKELQAINEEQGDEREKIEKAIVLLFGMRPYNTTFQTEPDGTPSLGSAPEDQSGGHA